MYCPSCSGNIRLVKGWVRHYFDGVATAVEHGPFAYCEDCALVSQVDPDRGVMVDLSLSMSVVFDRQQPRPILTDFPTFKGRTES